MHFHADGCDWDISWVGLAWRVTRKRYQCYELDIRRTLLNRCNNLWGLSAIIVISSRTCWSPWFHPGIVGALGGFDPEGGRVRLDQPAASCF